MAFHPSDLKSDEQEKDFMKIQFLMMVILEFHRSGNDSRYVFEGIKMED